MQRDRGEILRAVIVANGGKMLAKDARKKMHLIRSRFSELLATMKDEIEIKPYHLHKNWKVPIISQMFRGTWNIEPPFHSGRKT